MFGEKRRLGKTKRTPVTKEVIMHYRIVAVLAALVLIPSVASAQTVEPGMQFSGTLSQAISSKDANVGDPVDLMNVRSSDGSITGATMLGSVAAVTRAGQGRNAQIQLQFATLRLANGQSYPIDGQVMQLKVNTANNGAKEAAGALAGMIVGNILGKWAGVNGGSIATIGAAGGYVIAKNSRENVTIPSNSTVSVRLIQHPQQTYPQQTAPPYYTPPAPATPLPR